MNVKVNIRVAAFHFTRCLIKRNGVHVKRLLIQARYWHYTIERIPENVLLSGEIMKSNRYVLEKAASLLILRKHSGGFACPFIR